MRSSGSSHTLARKTWRRPTLGIAGVLLGLALLVGLGCLAALQLLPDPREFRDGHNAMAGHDNMAGHNAMGGRNVLGAYKTLGETVSLAEVPPYFLSALALASSCPEGDLSRNVAAWSIVQRVFGDEDSGCAVFSRQLARRLFQVRYGHEPSAPVEALLAVRISLELRPDEVLERYINTSPWGGGVTGLQAASRHYFGVTAANLDLAQAALLAAVAQAPDRLDPVRFPEVAKAARDRLLFHLVRFYEGRPELAESLMAQPLGLLTDAPEDTALALNGPVQLPRESAILSDKAKSSLTSTASGNGLSLRHSRRKRLRKSRACSSGEARKASISADSVLLPSSGRDRSAVQSALSRPPVPPSSEEISQTLPKSRWRRVKNWVKRIWDKIPPGNDELEPLARL